LDEYCNVNTVDYKSFSGTQDVKRDGRRREEEEEEEEAAEPIGALYRVVCSFMGHGLSASRFGLIIIIAILSPHRRT